MSQDVKLCLLLKIDSCVFHCNFHISIFLKINICLCATLARGDSLCQLVDKWEREDAGQIRVLISFHQLWMPAELKVNICGFSKPSRCLESMDWLVLAAPLSVFVGRPGPISNVSQPHLSQQLPAQNHYTLYCIPLQHSFPHRLFSSFSPHHLRLLSVSLDMSHCGLCYTR